MITLKIKKLATRAMRPRATFDWIGRGLSRIRVLIRTRDATGRTRDLHGGQVRLEDDGQLLDFHEGRLSKSVMTRLARLGCDDAECARLVNGLRARLMKRGWLKASDAATNGAPGESR
jgi:hypothetical protein